MKVQHIPKISPQIEMTFPTLLHCRTGECGGCPNGTGKLLWIPKGVINYGTTVYDNTFILNFQYNFFDKNAESDSPIKFNYYTNGLITAYSNPPNKAWTIANNAVDNYVLSPNLMRGTDKIVDIGFNMSDTASGGWLFFRQPNPAISNVHDALCFEYNHEKRLITFRSF